MSFLHGMFLLFLGLKLCSIITWSWWLIFLPWIGHIIFKTLEAIYD